MKKQRPKAKIERKHLFDEGTPGRYKREWQKQFNLLKQFTEAHGHPNVPKTKNRNWRLYLWTRYQRRRFQLGILPLPTKRALDSLGFRWAPKLNREKWDIRYREVKALVARQDGRWTSTTLTKSAYYWIVRQRQNKARLSRAQIKKLSAIGFPWSPGILNRRNHFAIRMDELRAFRHRFGHTKVPRHDPRHKQLANWMRGVRARKHLLIKSQIDELNALGFPWTTQTTWNEHYDELKKFHFRFGHSHPEAPSYRNKYAILARWTITQRNNERGLSKEQISLLNQINFTWQRDLDKWRERYLLLRSFYQRQGHCHVRRTSAQNHALADWAKMQRVNNNSLSNSQINQLNDIGFKWNDPD